jgi:hypothetical protein
MTVRSNCLLGAWHDALAPRLLLFIRQVDARTALFAPRAQVSTNFLSLDQRELVAVCPSEAGGINDQINAGPDFVFSQGVPAAQTNPNLPGAPSGHLASIAGINATSPDTAN